MFLGLRTRERLRCFAVARVDLLLGRVGAL